MNIKDQIRVEIERLKDTAWRRADNRYGREDANTYEAWAGAYEKVLETLDTIPEQPTNDFCKENCKGYQETGKCFSDGPCAAKQEASKEQPVEVLEEEIKNYYGRMPDDTDKIESARHFAEWMKAKMLKEAVEGTVCKDESDVWIELRPDALPNFKDMQPVKLIVKEDVE